MGGLVQAYVFTYLYCFYLFVALGWVYGIKETTMKMKDFKAALEAKLRFAEKNLKVEDDFYMGYVSCMEDMLEFIDGGEEDGSV